VKVGPNSGSGVLIQRQGQTYTVLTNRHVIRAGAAPYVIQTPGGRSHPAIFLKKINFRDNDLALLQFRSSESLAIATFGRSDRLRNQSPVISAGFPIADNPGRIRGFLVTQGHISLIPEKAFQGGYQLGYTNLVYQGMSGGPVLNLHGEVVGINSLHAYPLWGDPYVFQDGSKPQPEQRSIIVQSSWAVPIEVFLRSLSSSLLPSSTPSTSAFLSSL
jgi:S1-C subfamily serine protease